MRSDIFQIEWTRLFCYAVLGGNLLALGFLSLNPWLRPESGEGIFSPDKFDHAFAYGGLSLIVFFCLHKHVRSTAQAWMAAMLVSASIGALIEIAQSFFTHNRTGSIGDALANAIGAALGCAVYFAVQHLRA